VPVFKAEYIEWEATLHILFDNNNISATDIINLLNIAGWYSGIGSRRPEKNGGAYGRYRVAAQRKMTAEAI